jgi:tetratricopeptide (TPR) repeat protein
MRATVYNDMGDLDSAIADCTDAIRLDPDNPAAYQLRAEYHRSRGDDEEAEADERKVQQLERPIDAVKAYNRGVGHFRNGEFDKAIADFTEALQLDPENADAYDCFAWLRATCPKPELRDGEQALRHAEKACELTQWKAPAHFGSLAAAHAELGRFDEAVKWQKKYLESGDCPNEEMEEVRSRLKQFEAGKPYRDK